MKPLPYDISEQFFFISMSMTMSIIIKVSSRVASWMLASIVMMTFAVSSIVTMCRRVTTLMLASFALMFIEFLCHNIDRSQGLLN